MLALSRDLSFTSALSFICRILSAVRLNRLPISSRLCGICIPIPKKQQSISFCRAVRNCNDRPISVFNDSE